MKHPSQSLTIAALCMAAHMVHADPLPPPDGDSERAGGQQTMFVPMLEADKERLDTLTCLMRTLEYRGHHYLDLSEDQGTLAIIAPPAQLECEEVRDAESPALW